MNAIITKNLTKSYGKSRGNIYKIYSKFIKIICARRLTALIFQYIIKNCAIMRIPAPKTTCFWG